MESERVPPSRLQVAQVYKSIWTIPDVVWSPKKTGPKMSGEDKEHSSMSLSVSEAFKRRNESRRKEGKGASPPRSDVWDEGSCHCSLMWKAARNLPAETRVFTISGEYPDVALALLSRGWVQNPDENSPACDLMWRRAAKPPDFINSTHIFNHFRSIFHISTKICFTEHLKTLSDLCGVHSDEFYPRADVVRLDSNFEQDFKVTSAISLLKRFCAGEPQTLSKVYISLEIARNRTKLVSDPQWKLLKATTENTVNKMSDYCGVPQDLNHDMLLKVSREALHSLRNTPQFDMDGDKNLWIIKPGRKSRGRDIFLGNNLDKIRAKCSRDQSWIAQKYIETPLLILGRKFDIRQWVLVTAFQPLTIWFYSDCYLRFAAVDYTLDNLEDLFVHLTNNSISKHSDLYESAPIPGLMWHSAQFQDFLRNEHGRDVWSEELQPKIKDIVIKALLSVNPHVRRRPKCFELLGFDLMVDEGLRPWLLEVNVSPAMDYSTAVTERLVKSVLEDTIRVVVDLPKDKHAYTGKFLRIFG